MRKPRPRSALRPGRHSEESSFRWRCREYWRALMVVTVSLGEFNISWMLQTPYTNASGRPGRQLRVNAAGSGQRLHIHLLCHLGTASHAHAETSGTPEQTPCAQKQIRTGKKYGSEPQSGTGSVSIELKTSSKHYARHWCLPPFRSRWKPAAVPCVFFVLPPKTKQTLRAAAALS